MVNIINYYPHRAHLSLLHPSGRQKLAESYLICIFFVRAEVVRRHVGPRMRASTQGVRTILIAL